MVRTNNREDWGSNSANLHRQLAAIGACFMQCAYYGSDTCS